MSLLAIRKYFWHLRELGSSNLLRTLAFFKPWLCRQHLRGDGSRLSVCIDARVGFFAQMNWVLAILAHCEERGLRPHIELTGPFYAEVSGENWLERFFTLDADRNTQLHLMSEERHKCRISDLEQLGLPGHYLREMSLQHAHALWQRYMHLDQEIAAHVELFAVQHFTGRCVLGVHYRGTDKGSEAPPVSREDCVGCVIRYLDAHPSIDLVFLSSDEAGFIDWFKQLVARVEIVVHDDQARSYDGRAVHTHSVPGNVNPRGREALVNCLLLARCNALIRTASFLSAWSSVFNPALPVVMLNRPYSNKLWFPDSEIVRVAGHCPKNTAPSHFDDPKCDRQNDFAIKDG